MSQQEDPSPDGTRRSHDQGVGLTEERMDLDTGNFTPDQEGVWMTERVDLDTGMSRSFMEMDASESSVDSSSVDVRHGDKEESLQGVQPSKGDPMRSSENKETKRRSLVGNVAAAIAAAAAAFPTYKDQATVLRARAAANRRWRY